MSIGEKLRAARLARDLSLEDVFQTTRIRRVYLQAMEDEDWDALPSPVHVRGFLRAYAEFLGLDADALWAELSGETQTEADESAAAAADEVSPPETEEPPETPPPLPDEPEPPPESPPDDAEPPLHARIFAEIGETLRQRRELLGLSLDEISFHTHIAKNYLQSLESGDFEQMPTSMQMRGMLQQYADFIELDAEKILLRFAEGLQALRLAHLSETGISRSRWRFHLPFFLQRVLSVDLFLIVFLTLVFSGMFLWWRGALISMQNPAASPALPSISDVLLAQATPSPAATALPATKTAIPQQALLPGTPVPTESTPLATAAFDAEDRVQITLSVSRRVWLRVLVDGREVLRERAVAGMVYDFGGKESVEVQTSDAAALEIYYNGRNMGLLGPPETLLTLIFSADAVMTPTATVSPTPTETLTPTPTPTPTRTPRP